MSWRSKVSHTEFVRLKINVCFNNLTFSISTPFRWGLMKFRIPMTNFILQFQRLLGISLKRLTVNMFLHA